MDSNSIMELAQSILLVDPFDLKRDFWPLRLAKGKKCETKSCDRRALYDSQLCEYHLRHAPGRDGQAAAVKAEADWRNWYDKVFQAIQSSREISGEAFDLVEFGPARLPSVKLSNCSLTEATGNGTDFSKAQFHKCDLTGASFLDADFSGSILTDCCLGAVEFRNCNLSNARIDDATFDRVAFDEGSVLESASLARGKFERTRIAPTVSMIDADISDATFFDSDLRGLDLTRAVMRGPIKISGGDTKLLGMTLTKRQIPLVQFTERREAVGTPPACVNVLPGPSRRSPVSAKSTLDLLSLNSICPRIVRSGVYSLGYAVMAGTATMAILDTFWPGRAAMYFSCGGAVALLAQWALLGPEVVHSARLNTRR